MGLRDVAAVLAGGRSAPVRRAADLDATAALLGGRSLSGTTVSYDVGVAHAAVYACVDLLVRKVGWQMPAYVGDGLARAEVVVNPHPEAHKTAGHWKAEVLEPAMLRGYACGMVTSFEPSGWPRKILPVHPDLLTWWDDNGRQACRVVAGGRVVVGCAVDAFGAWVACGQVGVGACCDEDPVGAVGHEVRA